MKTDYLIITLAQKRFFDKKGYICFNDKPTFTFRNNLIIKIK